MKNMSSVCAKLFIILRNKNIVPDKPHLDFFNCHIGNLAWLPHWTASSDYNIQYTSQHCNVDLVKKWRLNSCFFVYTLFFIVKWMFSQTKVISKMSIVPSSPFILLDCSNTHISVSLPSNLIVFSVIRPSCLTLDNESLVDITVFHYQTNIEIPAELPCGCFCISEVKKLPLDGSLYY